MEVAPPHTVGSEADIATVVPTAVLAGVARRELRSGPGRASAAITLPLRLVGISVRRRSDAYFNFAILFPAADHARLRRQRTGPARTSRGIVTDEARATASPTAHVAAGFIARRGRWSFPCRLGFRPRHRRRSAAMSERRHSLLE